MVGRKTILIALIATLGLGMQTAWAQPSPAAPAAKPAHPDEIKSVTAVTAHGKIVMVDRAKKLVTLEGADGRKVTILVENPYNLKAAKVGDPVVIHFYEVVSIRKKKHGENVPTASIKEGISTAHPGGVPGAVVEQKVKLLLTVEAIDLDNGTVTLKAPDGSDEKVKAKNPRNLKRLKVGDELVVTVERAVGISIEQEPKA
jgi:hypothetical protein